MDIIEEYFEYVQYDMQTHYDMCWGLSLGKNGLCITMQLLIENFSGLYELSGISS